MKKDKKLIPTGYYCYTLLKNHKRHFCPYWSIKKDKLEQENGYCAYLEKGDWDINKEVKWETLDKNGKKVKGKLQSANEIGFPMSLLWDSVKECGINEEE